MFYNKQFVLLIKKIHRLIQHVKNNFTKTQDNLSNPLLFPVILFTQRTPHTFLAAVHVGQVPFYP